MRRRSHWAFGVAAACPLIMGLGIASCSDETSSDGAGEVSLPIEPISAQPEAVTPPTGLRKVEAPACVVGDACPNEFPPPFFVHDLGQSDTHLFVAFRYRGSASSATGTEQQPAAELGATVSVNGCSIGRVTARGGVRQASDGVSWVEVPLSELPEGEIELRLSGRVGTAGVHSSLSLMKTAAGVSYLHESQRQGYREVVEVVPGTGVTRTVAISSEPDVECAP